MSVVSHNWTVIDGRAALAGVDPVELPLDRLCNLAEWLATEGAEQREVELWQRRLWMPPKGVVAREGLWSVEAETAAFKQLVSETKG